MKYVVVCCDGMADRPVPELSGRTPMEAAKKPNMDGLAGGGSCGMLKTFYPGLPYDSGVANLVLLGYDPKEYYPGRGPLEAAYMRLDFGDDDVALRANTITERDGVLVDYSAGHITSREASEIIECADEMLGGDGVSFHAGVSYRHVILLKGDYSPNLACTPPHDMVGEKISDHLIKPTDGGAAETASKLNELMLASKGVLKDHPVNEKRMAEGKKPANMLWFWGSGTKPKLPSFRDKHGISGALISAVNILKGIAITIGVDVIEVPGATGYIDTDYEGKADAVLSALSDHDLVYVHVESTDECGHGGDWENKVKAIEDIDERLLGRILTGIPDDCVISVVIDHATPVSERCHTDEPVPFLIHDPREEGDDVKAFTESEAKNGRYDSIDGKGFMKLLLGRKQD